MNNQDFSVSKSSISPLKIGKNCKFILPSNIYGCILGDNVFVGPFCEIQSNVTIGKNTRIQSHSFICSLVTIGDECRIGHGVMFINDLYRGGKPSGGDKNKWMGTYIGSSCLIGSNATILPVSICDHVVIGAGAVVTKDITIPGTYVGNPAKLI